MDVARLASVSRATAARALTHPHLLRSDTLAAVTSAIESLGYVADASARQLASGRSGMIGAVVPTLEHAVFAKAIHRLQTGLADGGLQLVVAAHEYNVTHELRAIRSLLSRGIDAIVLVGAERPGETWSVLRNSRVPVIITYTFHPDFDSIGFDNARAGYLAARHIIALGHSRIGFISGPLRSNDRMAQRIEGVAKALTEAGFELPPSLISEQEFSLSGGKLGVHALMSLGSKPTAIIGGNDIIAAGALHELQARGFKVPDDVSVIGIENLDITLFTTPTLTSVALPTAEIGTATARHVLALIRKEPVVRRTEFPVSLVERASTGPAGARERMATPS
ncbi:MAG: substrate-binding domain-containing protein [Hyphomicrobiaceae bacterium]